MCTVTIERGPAILRVTMNRDEARSRAPEQPPDRHPDPTPWLAPVDGERGGTWMGVNAAGVVACLLNGYREGGELASLANPGGLSRGFIVPEILAYGRDVFAWLPTSFSPSKYPSFTLIVVTHHEGVVCGWDGADEWRIEPLTGTDHFFASSLWRREEVIAYRAKAYDTWRQAGKPLEGLLPRVHLLGPPEDAEYAPLMDRELSCTRSITQALVTPTDATLHYWQRDPGATVNGAQPTATAKLTLQLPPPPRWS